MDGSVERVADEAAWVGSGYSKDFVACHRGTNGTFICRLGVPPKRRNEGMRAVSPADGITLVMECVTMFMLV